MAATEKDVVMATALRRIWLQAIAVIALLIAWVADDIQGYRANDVLILGAMVTIALGGHILDVVAGPAHNSPPNIREILTYLTPPSLAYLSLAVYLVWGHLMLFPVLLTGSIVTPFAIYGLIVSSRNQAEGLISAE